METLLNPILKNIFGSNCNIISQSIITDGYKNTTFKIICNKYEAPLFVKIEKPFTIPRTQLFQIKKEVAGITLCGKVGIPVPKIIKADEEGLEFGRPWIVENFINDKLIHEFHLGEDNKETLGVEYETLYSKISGITNDFFGDTFDSGFIGKHQTWHSAIAKMTQLIYEDCIEADVFGDKIQIVDLALKKALSKIKSSHRSVFFHCDLFSANIMGVEKDGTVHISHIIDFGMSLFASECYSKYLTWKYTDFHVTPLDINKKYSVDPEELEAYDILRLEPILLANIFKINGLTAQYVQKCEGYIMK